MILNVEDVPSLTINYCPNYHQALLETERLGLSIRDKGLFANLNLMVRNHGVVSLEGKDGADKSTLPKLLPGRERETKYRGKYSLANGSTISYLSQSFTIYRENLREFAQKQGILCEDLLNMLKKIGFPRSSFETPIEEMSISQQKRITVAKSLVEKADLYLWDEPVNYLDVFNQDQLIKLLREVKSAMLLIEHDKYFTEQVVDQRIIISN